VIDELGRLDDGGHQQRGRIDHRLAQMARAVGIHLISRRSGRPVDVITGLIKAELSGPHFVPRGQQSGLAHHSRFDGSESLLGRGDMLYLPAGSARLHRIHGPLVSEDEITSVLRFWREQAQASRRRLLAARRMRTARPKVRPKAMPTAEKC